MIFSQKRVKKVLETVENAKGKKLSPAEINKIAQEMVRQIEECPELFEEVLKQSYEKGLEILPPDLRAELPAELIKEGSKSDKVPDENVVKATEAIAENLPDDTVVQLARKADLGIKEKNAIVEAGISDEERKREEKVNLVIDNLHRLHDEVEDIIKDGDVTEKIEKIMETLPEAKEVEEAEQYRIDQLVNSIIAKKIMQNYIRFGNTKFDSFSKIQSPEEMFANNIPQLAKCEYKNIPTSVRKQYKREYEEEVFRKDLIAKIAERVAKDFVEDGFKKIRIPQSKQMQNISEEEEQYLLEIIKQKVEKANGKINPLTEMDIKEQIRGNVKAAEKVEEYVATMDQLPADTKETFIQQGQEIMSDKNLLEISDYCNQVGLYQALASLGVDKAKKLVDTVILSIEKRKREIVSKENTPKVVGAKFEKKNKDSKTPLDDNDAR